MKGDDPKSQVWRLKDYKGAYYHAKRMYLDGATAPQIGAVTGFKVWEIHKFARGEAGFSIGWLHEIYKWNEDVMDEVLKKTRKSIKEIFDTFTDKVADAVDKFDSKNMQFTEEILQGVKVLATLNEMDRLEQDKPTKIFGYQELTRHNLKEKFKELVDLGIPIGLDLEALLINTEPPVIPPTEDEIN